MAATTDRHGRLAGIARQAVARTEPRAALAAYIRAAKARDYSGRQALELYRRAGGRCRTADWYVEWAEVPSAHR